MKLKKLTQRDRYGNQVTYEYEGTEKPLDPTRLMEKQMEMAMMPPPETPPPVMGEQFNMGHAPSHPGEPMGEDTVPAWLTPGEYVVNKEATEMFGPEIHAMNEVGRMAQGGAIHRNQGGEAYLQLLNAAGADWGEEGRNRMSDYLRSIGQVESGQRYDRLQGDHPEGIGRGYYQFERTGSGTAADAAQRYRNQLAKYGLESPLSAEDMAILNSDQPDFAAMSPDAQDAAALANILSHPRTNSAGIASGEVPFADSWADTHWAGWQATDDRALRDKKIEQFYRENPQYRFGGGKILNWFAQKLGMETTVDPTQVLPAGEGSDVVPRDSLGRPLYGPDAQPIQQPKPSRLEMMGEEETQFNKGGQVEPKYYFWGDLVEGLKGTFAPNDLGGAAVPVDEFGLGSGIPRDVAGVNRVPAPMSLPTAPYNDQVFRDIRVGDRNIVPLEGTSGLPMYGAPPLPEGNQLPGYGAAELPSDSQAAAIAQEKAEFRAQVDGMQKTPENVSNAVNAYMQRYGVDEMTAMNDLNLFTAPPAQGLGNDAAAQMELDNMRIAQEVGGLPANEAAGLPGNIVMAPNQAAPLPEDVRNPEHYDAEGRYIGPGAPSVPGISGASAAVPGREGYTAAQQADDRWKADAYGAYVTQVANAGGIPKPYEQWAKEEAIRTARKDARLTGQWPEDTLSDEEVAEAAARASAETGATGTGQPAGLAEQMAAYGAGRGKTEEQKQRERNLNDQFLQEQIDGLKATRDQDIDSFSVADQARLDQLEAEQEANRAQTGKAYAAYVAQEQAAGRTPLPIEAWKQQAQGVPEQLATPENYEKEQRLKRVREIEAGRSAGEAAEREDSGAVYEAPPEVAEGLARGEVTEKVQAKLDQAAKQGEDEGLFSMDKLKESLKSEFKNTFSEENLSNLAVKYAGAMLFGLPHEQALNFALKDTMGRQEAAAASQAKVQQQAATLAQSKAATPESIQDFVESGGDFSKLKAPAGKVKHDKVTSMRVHVPGFGVANVREEGSGRQYIKVGNRIAYLDEVKFSVYDESTMGREAVRQSVEDNVRAELKVINQGLAEDDPNRLVVNERQISQDANEEFQRLIKDAELPLEGADATRGMIDDATTDYLRAVKLAKENGEPVPTSVKPFIQARVVSAIAGLNPTTMAGTTIKAQRQINNTIKKTANMTDAELANVWQNAQTVWAGMTDEEQKWYADRVADGTGLNPFSYFVKRLVENDPKALDIARAKGYEV